MTTSAAQKSAEAFRTISEVAEALKLPQHVLRFWETRFTQIKPLKRAGGRRFYRPEDVELLGAIRQLLYGEGYTIKGVQRILREQGPRAVAQLARQHGRAAPFEPLGEAEAASYPGDGEPDEGTEVSEAEAAAWRPDPVPAAPAGARPVPAAAPGAETAMAALQEALAEIETCRRILHDART